jgi:hypothetical protein
MKANRIQEIKEKIDDLQQKGDRKECTVSIFDDIYNVVITSSCEEYLSSLTVHEEILAIYHLTH